MNELIFERERENFPALQNSVYLQTASTGLIPTYVYDGVKRYQDDRYLIGGDSTWDQGLDTMEMLEASKAAIAEMLCCSAEDIAFGMNTSHVLTYFSANLSFSPGANVVIPADSYSTERYMWQIREDEGLEIRYAECVNHQVRPEEIIRLIDDNTVAVCCTYVNSSSGFRLDAEAIGSICRENDIYFLLDAAQGAGVLDIDVHKLKADVLAFNDYKWMLNYCGSGCAYISRRVRDAIKPKSAGWMSDAYRFYRDSEKLTLPSDCRCYDLGYPNISGIYGLGLAAKRYNALGRQNIQSYVLELSDYLCCQLAKIEGITQLSLFASENRSQIRCFFIDQSLQVTEDKLRRMGISCDISPAGNKPSCMCLRIGVHYYNNRKDVEALAKALKSCKLIGGKNNE